MLKVADSHNPIALAYYSLNLKKPAKADQPSTADVITKLPLELLMHIFSFIGLEHLPSVKTVNRLFYTIFVETSRLQIKQIASIFTTSLAQDLKSINLKNSFLSDDSRAFDSRALTQRSLNNKANALIDLKKKLSLISLEDQSLKAIYQLRHRWKREIEKSLASLPSYLIKNLIFTNQNSSEEIKDILYCALVRNLSNTKEGLFTAHDLLPFCQTQRLIEDLDNLVRRGQYNKLISIGLDIKDQDIRVKFFSYFIDKLEKLKPKLLCAYLSKIIKKLDKIKWPDKDKGSIREITRKIANKLCYYNELNKFILLYPVVINFTLAESIFNNILHLSSFNEKTISKQTVLKIFNACDSITQKIVCFKVFDIWEDIWKLRDKAASLDLIHSLPLDKKFESSTYQAICHYFLKKGYEDLAIEIVQHLDPSRGENFRICLQSSYLYALENKQGLTEEKEEKFIEQSFNLTHSIPNVVNRQASQLELIKKIAENGYMNQAVNLCYRLDTKKDRDEALLALANIQQKKANTINPPANPSKEVKNLSEARAQLKISFFSHVRKILTNKIRRSLRSLARVLQTFRKKAV